MTPPRSSNSQKRPVQSYAYNVHLRVEVVGPDADPDNVAQQLATRVQGMALAGGFVVGRTEIDHALDPEED